MIHLRQFLSVAQEPCNRLIPLRFFAFDRTSLLDSITAPATQRCHYNIPKIARNAHAADHLRGCLSNKDRLVVWINYAYRVVYIRFIVTHAQYDKIDAQTV